MIAKMILKMSEQVKAIVKKLVVGCYVSLRVETRCEWSEERVPRQDQEGEAFKRGCRKAMVGPQKLWFVTRLRHFEAAQKLMTWSLFAEVERWRCCLRSARNESPVVSVFSLLLPSCCFAFLFWDLHIYIVRGNAEDGRYGRWTLQ